MLVSDKPEIGCIYADCDKTRKEIYIILAKEDRTYYENGIPYNYYRYKILLSNKMSDYACTTYFFNTISHRWLNSIKIA